MSTINKTKNSSLPRIEVHSEQKSWDTPKDNLDRVVRESIGADILKHIKDGRFKEAKKAAGKIVGKSDYYVKHALADLIPIPGLPCINCDNCKCQGA